MSESGRILVVDDSPINMAILDRSLCKVGYTVLKAENGFKAVDLAVAEQPDLILLDMVMPKRDGLEVCRILKGREDTASIPVIFVTGEEDSDKIVQAFAVGGCDYITKPFTVDEILARVTVHLRLRQAEQDLVQRNAQLEVLANKLSETNAELAQQARTDMLTKVLNRGAWDESAELEHQRAERYGREYGIAMIDIDHFKAYNDSQGHPAGDDCLRRVASCIASACRAVDLVGRYGGEEFVVLVPDTDAEGALKLAQRIRKAIWDLAIQHPASRMADRVTASIGVATRGEGDLVTTLGVADQALYQAKNSGRNRVCVADVAISGNAPPEDGTSSGLLSSDEPGAAGGEGTVLIVDDNATNRAFCRACLAREKYTILEAGDGETALAAASERIPDVIIMDVVMPNMDGLECTRRLKNDPATQDVPVVMVSAKDATADILAGLESGADEYLVKPITPTELILRVRSMMRLRSKQKDLLRSFEMRAEQTRVLMLLLEFCNALGMAMDLEEVLERTIATVAEVATSRRVSIMLPDVDSKHLRIAGSMGIRREIADQVSVPVGARIAGAVFESRETVVVNNDAAGRPAKDNYDAPFFISHPLVSTPLGTGGKVVGVLNVTERASGRPFEAHELEYIDLIAGIAGSAIHSMQSRKACDDARDSIVIALAKLAEHRDNDTGKHLDRVTQYARMLAAELSKEQRFTDTINDEFLDDLERAVPLHDIGKVAIPDHILLKPGRLNDEEMEIMRTHARIGADTIRSVIQRAPGAAFLTMAERIARSHHEWFDGGGYPSELSGQDIPLCARIVALADAYDALTTRRPYKEAMSHERALTIITASSGSQFDPAVVEAFLQRAEDFAGLAKELADDTGSQNAPGARQKSMDAEPVGTR